MWGVIPAAGIGSRIQPLAFSKELLPVGSRLDGEVERPRAASEYLIDRLLLAGVDKICFVISPAKLDILRYYCGNVGPASICYVVQPESLGLCDAIFRVLPMISPGEDIVLGLPDTIWFPEDALRYLPDGNLSFLLFPVQNPELFDAVVTDQHGRVLQIETKQQQPNSYWIWGAIKCSREVLQTLYDLWVRRKRKDEYLGGLINEYLSEGGQALAVNAGTAYVDVGTLDGYREALLMLAGAGQRQWMAERENVAGLREPKSTRGIA